MKRLSLLVMVLLIVLGDMTAAPVSQQQALRAGANFLNATALRERKAAVELQLVYASTAKGETDYYVFNVADGNGFVIVAGDDRVKPILAYSTTGSYDPEDVAEGFEFTLNGFCDEIHYVREHGLPATPDIVAEWNAVTTRGLINPERQSRSVVGPLCQTTWNQNYPYNSQCPEDPDGNGGYVYAGCVATAMAQVMKYWDYPDRGTGSHTYNPSGYPQQTANFGATDYHFELMPLALDSTSTDDEIFYIAQFLHHCGIAVDMQYSGNGSGAYSNDVPPALQNYFGFSTQEFETLSYWGWSWYTNEEWAQMLKDGGLDEQMPLYYSGSDDGGAGGHAFVCDGYDENDYFHFNWGWSGRDDAWCPIGALNTTKYAFNDANSFIGHIMPANTDYGLRADSVADFNVVENASFDGVMLGWTNPSVDLNGNALTSIDSVVVRRNNQVIAVLTNAQVGEAMILEDNGLEPGLYQYAIFVCNTAGISRNVYRTILVGEKCDITFVLHDEGGDGWKGAAISVASESGQRIAVVTMTEGSELTVTVPLLKQNLDLIWNHGWYHTNAQYDTDFECSFSVYDFEGNELYVSGELEDGVFLTFENNCEGGVLTCYPVQNLQGEYVWVNEEEYGGQVTWDAPSYTANLHHFNLFREADTYKEEELIAEIPYDGNQNYEFFDNTYGITTDVTRYIVTSIYVRDDEQCESDFRDVLVNITDVNENALEVTIYPNPTEGQLVVEGTGELNVVVMNLLGQRVLEAAVRDKAVLDLGQYEAGIYVVRVETAEGVVLRKVSLK